MENNKCNHEKNNEKNNENENNNNKTLLQKSLKLGSVYVGWISTHYIASHLYTKICTPLSIKGFIASAFNTATPHCTALRWCVYQGANTITNMWIMVGLWVVSKVST